MTSYHAWNAIAPAAAMNDKNPHPALPPEVITVLIIIVSATSTAMRGLLIFYGFAPGCWGRDLVKMGVGRRADFACSINGGIKIRGKWLIRYERSLCL